MRTETGAGTNNNNNVQKPTASPDAATMPQWQQCWTLQKQKSSRACLWSFLQKKSLGKYIFFVLCPEQFSAQTCELLSLLLRVILAVCTALPSAWVNNSHATMICQDAGNNTIKLSGACGSCRPLSLSVTLLDRLLLCSFWFKLCTMVFWTGRPKARTESVLKTQTQNADSEDSCF